jgi:predicted nucleotidyltransferase component of viral defense system
MIDKPEIDTMAERLDVNTSDVQRDYAFGWLLAGMFEPTNPLSRLLVLKGGNCFRKAYFEEARYSSDLDFGTESDVDPAILLGGITQASEYAKAQSGIQFLIDDSSVKKKRVDASMSAFEARVYFQSFYGEQQDLRLRVTVDVKEFEAIYLPVQSRKLVHAYSDAELCRADLRCLKLEELLAQKLKALLMRRHSPDLFDFVHSVFFQKALSVKRTEILSTFYKLTVYESDPSAARALLLALPFETIRGFWNQYISCPKASLFSFDDAADWFKRVVTEIFNLADPRFTGAQFEWRRGNAPYFSAEHRDLMFEAGRLQRMLLVRYDGYERMVEPYALTFKHAQGQSPREYFYGFDTTGGQSQRKSIKAFVAEKIESIVATEEEFEPQFAIELVKGGDYFGKSDFSRPGTRGVSVKRSASFLGLGLGGRSAARSKRTQSPFGQTYKFKCMACDKVFTRSKYDPNLNAHKDKYNNSCYGRVGYQV